MWKSSSRRSRPADAQERFDQAVRLFSAPRFQALYRAWWAAFRSTLEARLAQDEIVLRALAIERL